jgi:dipeptidyl aminopeptidase/acylaminoacyl peptidase
MKKFILPAIIVSLLLFACEKNAETEKNEKADSSQQTVTGEQHLFTAEDMYTVKRLSGASLSPDGQWVVYQISTPSIEDNKLYTDLYLMKSDGSDIKQLTDDPASDRSAVWMPDSKSIAFLSSRDGSTQIYTMTIPEGKISKVSDMENGVANLRISPDGKYFSFTSELKIGEDIHDEYPKYDKANVLKYTDLPARHWDEWTDHNYSHLFIMPVEGGEAKDLMEGEKYDTPLKPFGGVSEIAWSADSKEIAYTAKKYSGVEFVTNTNSDIFVYNLGTDVTTNITEGMPGFDKNPLYSPDNKMIAFTSMERATFEADKIRLMVLNTEDGEIFEVTKNLDQWVNEFVWKTDNSGFYFTATDSGRISVFETDLEGNWTRLATGMYNYGNSFDLSTDGKTLLVGRESMLEPVDFYAINTENGDITRLTNANENLMANIKKSKIEERWITSTDGKKVHTWVVYPPDFDPNKKYPMISYLQGGPQSMIGQRFHYRWNYFLMASNNYIVMLPNRRGLPGFGQDWNDAISKDWGGMPMTDILACTDALSSEPYVDENKLTAVGASAGGYAAFWLAGHHEGRFKAFIAHCGVFNVVSKYASTEELWFPNWEFGGPYWEEENMKYYKEHSPHYYVKNWDTPILITTGVKDFRVPYTQSLEAFTAARAQGIDAELLVFPEETHFIAHPQEFIIWNNEFFNFLNKYTGN